LETGCQSIARRIPVGIIGIITPWNSPFILGARAIGPALAMGNAVILKPDVQTPVAGGVTFARLLEAAGLPNGLFHVLPGGPETGAALVKEPLVNMISFTGSTRVGRQVGSVASGQLKRVSLELGGNNPYIVLDDVSIEAAASAGAWGAFFHQGQICLTGGRHLVHERVVHGVYGPIGGVGASGNGFGHGTVSNADQFSEWQWITTRSQIPAYPF
jgi:benzaldehyde dehydrogenase (NAD)